MSTRTSQRRDAGAALNNTRRSQGRTSREPDGGAVLIGTGISFSGASTILDSGNGMGAITVGRRIRVSGSPKNSRTWLVHGVTNAGQITVRPAQVTTESAGARITIELVD
jgi:hypothetical protein